VRSRAGGGVLISGAVRERIPDQWRTDPATDKRLRGVPEDVFMYRVIRRPDAPKTGGALAGIRRARARPVGGPCMSHRAAAPGGDGANREH
jgi:hypothetical protein